MPVFAKVDPNAINTQVVIIEDATPFSDGVMSKGQVQQLDANTAAIAGLEPGFTPAEHERLRQLIHFISEGPTEGFASGAFKEVLPIGAPFPASVTWYTSSTKAQKIVEKFIVRNANKTPSQITWNMYADDGVTIIQTVVDDITYANAVFEATRTRTIS